MPLTPFHPSRFLRTLHRNLPSSPKAFPLPPRLINYKPDRAECKSRYPPVFLRVWKRIHGRGRDLWRPITKCFTCAYMKDKRDRHGVLILVNALEPRHYLSPPCGYHVRSPLENTHVGVVCSFWPVPLILFLNLFSFLLHPRSPVATFLSNDRAADSLRNNWMINNWNHERNFISDEEQIIRDKLFILKTEQNLWIFEALSVGI